jgi:hypothetical protein
LITFRFLLAAANENRSPNVSNTSQTPDRPSAKTAKSDHLVWCATSESYVQAY